MLNIFALKAVTFSIDPALSFTLTVTAFRAVKNITNFIAVVRVEMLLPFAQLTVIVTVKTNGTSVKTVLLEPCTTVVSYLGNY